MLVGPPGSGKVPCRGDCARVPAPEYRPATPACRNAGPQQLAAGDAIPDKATLRPTAHDRLLRVRWKGLIQSGFRRRLPTHLAPGARPGRHLADFGRISMALALEVSDEEVVRRLSGRQSARAWASLSRSISTICRVLRCQERGGPGCPRRRPEVRQRLVVYHQQTQPLLDFTSRVSGWFISMPLARPPRLRAALYVQQLRAGPPPVTLTARGRVHATSTPSRNVA